MKFSGGKVIRDGDAEALDLVLTNALVLEAIQGVTKADIGIKHGRFVSIGHAGNPFTSERGYPA